MIDIANFEIKQLQNGWLLHIKEKGAGRPIFKETFGDVLDALVAWAKSDEMSKEADAKHF